LHFGTLIEREEPTDMYEGRIIEYIEQGKFICTLCLQDQGSKLHLLTPTNREVNLPPKRALLVSRGSANISRSREELLTRLRKAEETREALKGQIDVLELWELVREEGNDFDGKYLAELCFGDTVTDDHISALARALFEDKLYFKMKDTRFRPNSEDRIEQILREREEDAAREELLCQGGKWLSAIHEGKSVQDPSCKEEIIRLLVDLVVFGKESPHYKYGKDLFLRAGISDIGKAKNFLIKLGVWDEDENLDLIRFDVKTTFNQGVIQASRQMIGLDVAKTDREDLRDLDVFTIDGPLTRDFDDALSVEIQGDEIHLGIHIADVASVIARDSVLDREASQRGSSLYLPCLQVPMLPHDLSQDLLSLKQDCDRGALSLLCRFDKKGNLLDSRFTPSLIRVRRRLDYDHVDTFYQEDENLNTLYRFSQILHQRRLDGGAMVLSLPEIAIQINAASMIDLVMVEQNTPARMMVAESMILYNWLAARFCRDAEVPILYRGQERPGDRLPVDETNYPYFVFKQRRKISPLMIDTRPRPHSGLGLDVYTNVSSPIRRYADLVIQRQVRNVLLDKSPAYHAEDLEKIRMALGSVLKDLNMVKRNRLRYWLQKYLHQHEGEVFPAFVLDVMKSRYRLLLPDLLFAVEMKRQNGQDFQAGQPVKVRINKSDPWNDVLKVEYAGS